MPTNHLVVTGDPKHMRRVHPESVHLIATALPIWLVRGIRQMDYPEYKRQYDKYHSNLAAVWAECARVLAPGCKMCVAVADTFCSARQFGTYLVMPHSADVTTHLRGLGLDFQGAINWHYNTGGMGKARTLGSYPYPRNGIVNAHHQQLLLFKKPGETPLADKEASALTHGEWMSFFSDSWYLAGENLSQATTGLPLAAAARLVRMFTGVGETILDPFCREGHTLAAAKQLSRNSIGYEKDMDYLGRITASLEADAPDAQGITYQFLKD